MNQQLRDFLDAVKGELVSRYGDNLASLVIYGSVARGDWREGSDIDLLVVLHESSGSLAMRIDEFMKLEREIRKTTAYVTAKTSGLPHRMEPIVLTLEEFRSHPPLLLDMTDDSMILYDRDEVFTNEMEVIRKRLKQLGARKVVLKNGNWYWILKPDLKFGEVVII